MSEIVDVRGEQGAATLARAAELLLAGELVVLPTDTLYGVAADAFSVDATSRLLRAKGRDGSLPLPVLIRSPKQLAGLVTQVPASADRLMAAYWPGPLTLVVPADPNLRWDLGRTEGTVAVRMPLDDVALDVIRGVGPLAVTSANRHGETPGRTAAAAREQLGDAVSLYLDDGPRPGGVPSTIVDLTRRESQMLREGVVPGEEALAVARGEQGPGQDRQG